MINKNEIYNISIESVSSDGNGVGKIDGFTVFVPQTAPGDEASVQIVKVQKSYAYAKALEIAVPSKHRRAVSCPYFEKCGGCSLMHIKYDEQLEIKKGIINNALLRIAGTDCRVGEMLGADNEYRYRNKMIFPIGQNSDGSTVCGFYRSRSHDIVPMNDCLLGSEFNGAVIDTVLSYMKKYNVSAYDEKTQRGTIRRIFTRVGKSSGEIMLVISANTEKLPKKECLTDALCSISDKIVSIILNVNTKKTNLVLGDKNKVLFGKGTITDELCGAEYEISPHSFFQINHAQTEKLYKKALEYAAPSENDTVLDIYCGIGTISLFAARKAKRVIGVEIVPEAICDAKKNAEENGIENSEFFCADAERLVPWLIERGEKPDVVILDPPRKGSDEKTLNAIACAAPKRIVYVSCNPATLARDIKFLSENGYCAEKICGVDMFPNTNHVETITLLQKRNT